METKEAKFHKDLNYVLWITKKCQNMWRIKMRIRERNKHWTESKDLCIFKYIQTILVKQERDIYKLDSKEHHKSVLIHKKIRYWYPQENVK